MNSHTTGDQWRGAGRPCGGASGTRTRRTWRGRRRRRRGAAAPSPGSAPPSLEGGVVNRWSGSMLDRPSLPFPDCNVSPGILSRHFETMESNQTTNLAPPPAPGAHNPAPRLYRQKGPAFCLDRLERTSRQTRCRTSLVHVLPGVIPKRQMGGESPDKFETKFTRPFCPYAHGVRSSLLKPAPPPSPSRNALTTFSSSFAPPPPFGLP